MPPRTARIALRCPLWLLLAAAALACGACGDAADLQVPLARQGAPSLPAPPPGATDSQRFGFERPRSSQEPRYDLDLPEGWERQSPGPMRLVNLTLAGHPDVECYLTVLGRAGNTLLGNVNRWRGQMGAEPIDEAALASLPRHPLLGTDATFLELEGTLSDMSGAPARPDQGLLGLLSELPNVFLTFKMVGPKEVLQGERERFLAAAASLRVETQSAPPGHMGGAGSGAAAPAGPQPEVERGALTWTAPEGWESLGATGMREVTFRIGSDGTECWVTFLGLGAGGVEANVNRWRSELGLAALAENEIQGLTRIPVMGVEGVLVEGEGDWSGMGKGAVGGAGLLGLIATLSDRTLFVKLVGPAASVRAERGRLEAFCRSLEMSK